MTGSNTTTQAENSPDPAQIATLWSLPSPTELERVPDGINNRSWYVTAGAERYVLRVYHSPIDPARISREHTVLRALSGQPLSFRVPVPVATMSGETATTLDVDGEQTAVLFPFIPGRHPYEGGTEVTRMAGAALGELDAALARLNLPAGLSNEPSPERLLDGVHPAVPDVRALPERLGLDSDRRGKLARILATAAEEAPAIYAILPRQWVHADFAAANLLTEDGAITGVLDFEFAHIDLRALDPAWSFCLFGFDRERRGDLALIDAFGQGYTRWIALTVAERRAFPSLIRLCRTIVAVHWCARYLEGSRPREAALGNVETLLTQEAWLQVHGDELAERALRWPAGGHASAAGP